VAICCALLRDVARYTLQVQVSLLAETGFNGLTLKTAPRCLSVTSDGLKVEGFACCQYGCAKLLRVTLFGYELEACYCESQLQA
jgi:hypothetical protein